LSRARARKRKPRVATKPSARAVMKRLDAKRRDATRKRERASIAEE